MGNHKKLLGFLRPDPAVAAAEPSDDDDEMPSSPTSGYASPAGSPSPYSMSPPVSSPWTHLPGLGTDAAGEGPVTATGLIASLVKEDGHVYSLAAAGDLLYTGTDSKNVRVWKNRREFAGFKASSGLVKAIVVAGDGRIFTGHQDGKVRVWRASPDNPAAHRRVGSLPMLKDFLKSSVNPSNYIDTRRPRRRSAVWLRHFDAVSCLSLDADAGLLYSGSWDRTFKVWRLSDSKCLESVRAHDDAVNTVVAVGFDNVVFTGSADGTVKLWRREAVSGEGTRHVMERVLTKGESAVTAIAVSVEGRIVYVGTSDGAVNVWKWRRGTVRHSGVLKGHKMAVLCLAVAGRVVVTGSADRTLCAWRREGPEHVRLAVLTGHTGPVKCVAMDQEAAVGADRERLLVAYSGSLDGSVKVWRLSDASNMTAEQTAPPLPHAPKGKASPLHVRAPDAASEFKRLAPA